MNNTGHADQVAIDAFLHYYGSPQFLDRTRALAEQFSKEHPGYRVEIHGHDHLTLPEEVARAVKRGVKPAIGQFFYTSGQLAKDMLTDAGRPVFTSVEKAIGGRTEILGEPVVTTDILPALRDYYSAGGELLSVPTLASTTLLYANTTLLADAGVTAVPRTWAEIDTACAALARRAGGRRPGITWPNHGWLFQQALALQDGLLADRDNGRSGRAEVIDLASAEMLAYVRWWKRLHDNGHYLYSGTLPMGDGATQIWADNFAAFREQRVALVMTSSVEAELMVQAGRDGGFDVVASPLPHNEAAPRSGAVIGGDSLWLGAGLDKATEDGALAFLQYLNRADIAADRHKSGHYAPITKASVALLEEEGWFQANPHRRVAVDILMASNLTAAGKGAVLGDFAGIQDVISLAMHDVLVEGADPTARFIRATKEAQALLDDYNDHCLGRVDGPRGPHRFAVA
jgi:sn-glycerol 3-phosphate transport system substrate-binding protein